MLDHEPGSREEGHQRRVGDRNGHSFVVVRPDVNFAFTVLMALAADGFRDHNIDSQFQSSTFTRTS